MTAKNRNRLVGSFLVLFFTGVVVLLLNAQATYNWRFQSPVGGVSVTGNSIWYNVNAAPTSYPKLTWTLTGSLAACTIQVDYSTDGSTVAGQAIAAQTCTSSGNFTAVATSVYNYVRVSYVIGSGGGSLSYIAQGCVNGTCTSGGGTGTVTNSGNLVNNNFVLGAGTTSIKDYGSAVIAPANGGAAACSTVGICGFFPGLDSIPNSGLASAGGQVISIINVVDAYQFTLRQTQVVGHLSVRVVGTFGVSSHIGVGIYDSTKTRVINSGALDGTNVSTPQIVSFGQITLNPGIYWLGLCSDGLTSGRVYNIVITPSIAGYTQFVNDASGNRVVTGSNASVGGVCPASLGTLSAQTTVLPIAVYLQP